MYSPTLGRFMQTDPIGYGDGINWYDYVDGDPVNRSDPDGQTAKVVGQIVGEILLDAGLQYLESGNVDWKQAAKSGVESAINPLKKVKQVVRGAKIVKKEAGIVYRRINPDTGRCYIGRCNSDDLFKRRQRDHDRRRGVEHQYEKLDEIVETGRPLREREQQRLNENGGPTNKRNPNGGTENMRNEIAPCRGTRIGNHGTGGIC